MLASKKEWGVTDLLEQLLQTAQNGPTISGTFAEDNRFYDDRSTYTGVHKVGGPTIIDREKQVLCVACVTSVTSVACVWLV